MRFGDVFRLIEPPHTLVRTCEGVFCYRSKRVWNAVRKERWQWLI